MDTTVLNERPAVPEPERQGSDQAAERSGPDDGVELSSFEGGWAVALAVGFVLVVVCGLVLRFWTRSSMWLDEALTVNIARQPLSQLHALLRQDGAPPLYYVLLHFWMKIFGSSDLGARSLSGAISVVTLPVAWLAGRRLGGRPTAWVVLLLLASAPFAIYYATEARMYSLVMLLTACGILALHGALRRPGWTNLVALGVVTAALLYTQYWSLYLVATVGAWLVWRGWRRHQSDARWALLAVAVGCLAFVPWLPTFVFQARHTGTPWAPPSNFAAIINAVTGFTDNQATLSSIGSNQGRLLAVLYFVLAGLALFGAARSRWHIDLDLRTRPSGRDLAFVVIVTLVLAVTGGIVTRSAFSPRYASVVFIPLLILIALGTRTLVDARVRNAVLAIAAVAGLALGVENIWTQRTEAPQVASVLAAQAKPGDIVAFCPDQLGPAVYRLVDPGRYHLTTFPRGTSPEFVNWINYKQAAASTDPVVFAHQLQAEAGRVHQIWLVWATGYQGFNNRCETLASTLLDSPGWGGHNWVYLRPGHDYEPMQLIQFTRTSTP